MAVIGGGEGSGSEQNNQTINGSVVIDVVRCYSPISPYGFTMELRPLGLYNWTETIEGDTTVDVIISGASAAKFKDFWGGSFSQIISLVSDVKINRKLDVAYVGSGIPYSSYVFDSYYVSDFIQEENSENWRLTCVGMKEYLDHRLAIPAAKNTVDGTVTYPDGSDESKPIPSSQILAYTSKSYKGIVAGLLAETALLQAMPVSYTENGLSGTRDRTYLMKDFRSIKEAIDNLNDDQDGLDLIFDGGSGGRNYVNFTMSIVGDLQRGLTFINFTDRSSEIFTPTVELSQSETVNNLWSVGNAADGNILMAHKVQAGTTGNILLQSANTERNDIQTPSFLLDYTLGILQKSGQSVRTMKLEAGLTVKTFLAFVGNYITMTTPSKPDIDGSAWLIVGRQLDMESKKLSFDLMEVTLVEE